MALQLLETQREAIQPNRHIWVSASAGSGKTEILKSRYLNLLLQDIRPHHLLCLTYTRSGASEMAQRITHDLARWSWLPEEQLSEALQRLIGDHKVNEALIMRARRLFSEILDCPDGIRIQTIHAFCQSILTRFPIEAGIHPGYELLEPSMLEEMAAQAMNRFLEQSGREPEVRAALSVLADEYAATDLQSIFLQLTLGYAGFGAHDDVGAHDAVLGKVDSGAQPGPVCTLRAGDLSAMLGYVTTRQGEKLAGWLDHDPKDRSDTDYQAFFLTQNLAMRKGLYKSLDKKDPGLAAMFAGEADRLIKRITSSENARLVRINRACLTIQRQLTGFLEAEKSQTGRLGYDDLISLTNRLLQDAGDWVRYKLDDTIHHILIDEAQDTNPQQWQIINQLCEPFFTGQDAHSEQRIRTLFVVGDAKQSIYRFQGARHHIFEESRRRYQHRSDAIGQPFTALPMEVSFRCAPAILAIVDQVAGRPDLAKALTIEHEPITHCAHHQGRRGLVVVWPLLVQNASGNPAGDPSGWVLPDPEMKAPSVSTHLARAIAAKIEAMIGHCWLDSRGRYAMAGDFMILLRNRKPFMAPLIRALHARNIRATGSDEATLIDEPAIIDLRSLLGFLALPANDLALAETLRSPFIGLGEEALMELAAHRPKDHTLWQALQSHKDPVFTSARKWLLHLLGLSDLIQPWQLIRRCLDLPCPGPGEGAEPASSGRKALACRLGNQCFAALEAFANLAEQYERSTPASLGGFLDFARQYGKQHKLNIARVDQNQVQIMTVHAAKGLQAPIIMLPEYQRKHGHAENVRMHAFELDGIDHHQARGDEVHMMRLLRPSEWDGDCLDALQKAEDQRDLEEEYRLLYVAMTRAEDQLHVMGCTRFSKNSGEKIVEQGWYKAVLDGMFAAKAIPHNAPELGLVDDWFEEIWWSQESKGMVFGKQAEAHEHDARTEEVPVEIAKPDLPAWCLRKPPRESAGFALLRPSELIETHSGQPGDPVRQRAMRRGRFVHRLLEWVPKIPPDQREERIQHYVAANGADLDPADLADITRKILALLEHPEYAALFGPASRSEVRFAQMIKTGAASASGYHTVIGRIDRLVLYQDTILIVEYKSSKTIPQIPEQIKPAQLRQLAAYRDAAGAIYPDRSIETLMIWTDGPIIMNVPHHLLDQQAVWKV